MQITCPSDRAEQHDTVLDDIKLDDAEVNVSRFQYSSFMNHGMVTRGMHLYCVTILNVMA